MAEQTLTVHNSKLTYATIKKMVDLVEEYTNIRTLLSHYFPDVDDDNDQWDHLKEKCDMFLSNNANWIGTSPGASVSSQVNSYSVQPNPTSMSNLSQKVFTAVNGDPSIDFTDAQVWFDVLNKFVLLENLNKEYTMHKAVFNAVKDLDDTVSKEPEQLAIYDECEFPLPDNDEYPQKANYHAFKKIITEDSYYSVLPIYDIDDIVSGLAGYNVSLDFNIVKTTISNATYTHSNSIGYVIKATEVSDGTNLTNISFTDHNTMVVGGFVASAEVRLIEISLDVTTTSTSAAVIEPPTVSTPDAGMTVYTPITFESSTFEVSGAQFDLHTQSDWQIASDAGFSNVVHESENDNINLTSYTLDPDGVLSTDTNYYWRVRYTGATYGESEWSDTGTFKTSESYTCVAGTLIGGGVAAGTLNSNCIVSALSDAEPTGTNSFSVVADDIALFAITPSPSGTFAYREDTDKYYVNKNGDNIDIGDWILVDPIDEPNYDMFVDSESAQLALTVTTGNIAIRTDENKCYVNIDGTNVNMGDWIEIDTPVKIWWLAKQYCYDLSDNGYSDWYLPSASELNLLYTNKGTIDTADTTGNFDTWHYWSSTVDVLDEIYHGWEQYFTNGAQTAKDRDTRWYYVRPVRRL